MASVANDGGGRRRILFFGPDGRRHALRLGKVPQRTADAVKLRIELLVAAAMGRQAPDLETSRWLADNPRLAAKLARTGLVSAPKAATLKAFLDGYIGGRVDVKESTATVYGHTRRCLVEHFGSEKPLRAINAGAADGWRLYLIEQGLSENTVRRRCGIAKQFFKAAKRSGLIGDNPFADLAAAVLRNAGRLHFISRAVAEKVLDACPDAQWRLLFALSRYGGLRCPSEHLALKWGDVDWAKGRLTVRSPKTEHHEGGESRQVPLFPELRAFLADVFEQAEPGTEHVITRYRDRNANLRTQLERIIRRAGLKPWPKLFQNLRSTRETELAEHYPLHVVCAWIGNSRAVAAKHYLQVTDEHFDAAAREPAGAAGKAAQKAAQHAHESGRTEGNRTGQAGEESPENPEPALACADVQSYPVGDDGLEPPTPSV